VISLEPRTPHQPGKLLPPDWFRRSPRFHQSSGYAGQWIIGFPRISHPPALPCLNLRVAPFPRSSGNASDRFSPGFPWVPSIFRQCRSSAPRVAPVPRPLGCAVGWLSGLPPIAAPRRCRLRAFPGCPGPCTSTAGSMMTPRLDSNFASAACAVDESSSQSGLAHPEPGAPDASPSFNLGLLLTGLPRPASNQDSN